MQNTSLQQMKTLVCYRKLDWNYSEVPNMRPLPLLLFWESFRHPPPSTLLLTVLGPTPSFINFSEFSNKGKKIRLGK